MTSICAGQWMFMTSFCAGPVGLGGLAGMNPMGLGGLPGLGAGGLGGSGPFGGMDPNAMMQVGVYRYRSALPLPLFLGCDSLEP